MNDETIFKPIGKISMSIENVRKKKKCLQKFRKFEKKIFFRIILNFY